MKRAFFKRLVESGLNDHDLPSKKRSVVFSNYIALIFCLAILFLFIIIPQNHNVGGLIEAILTIAVFLFPILLNRLSFSDLSRLYLCWIPPVLITWAMIDYMKGATVVSVTSYDGLRIYLLSTSCIPYLLIEKKRPVLFALGIVPNFLILIFCDSILNFAGVGFEIKSAHEAGYEFTAMRSFIAYILISGSCLTLRFIVDKTDSQNEKLITELTEKNEVIRKQSKSELRQLNQQLTVAENNYQALFEQASDAIMITDLTGQLVEVNTGMCVMLGYEKEELLTKNINDLIDPEQLKENPVRFSELLDGALVLNERLMIHKSGLRIPIETNVKRLGKNNFMAIGRDVSERRITAQKLETANFQLNERVKELTALYHISQLLGAEADSIENIFNKLPLLIPPAFQFPEFCEARLSVFGKNYQSTRFSETTYSLKEDIKVDNSIIGSLEVVYLKETPHEVSFLLEERNLLQVIVKMLQIYIVEKQEEEELNKAQANLKATINNTEIMIWSVDRNFNLLTFNDSFDRFNQEYNKVKIEQGFNHRNVLDKEESEKWDQLFQSVLSGEIVEMEEKLHGMDLKFSLSPIIEKGQITGITVIADNVTEQNQRNQALSEANKKIGELKVMALRSVMNPHFIFNVLNSIQFFIAKNDRENAINYLSTFSKLIRTVLTHSVSDAISLTEEIELLKNYIELEKVRFEDKFDFNFEIDQHLNADEIQIPSLLIQPYIENAILHGLYNKQEQGKITIRIKESDDYLTFEIEDNGIGREASAKLKKQNQHKSMGTKLTEERLKLINERTDVAVQFTDLRTGEGVPAGTLVTVNIKI